MTEPRPFDPDRPNEREGAHFIKRTVKSNRVPGVSEENQRYGYAIQEKEINYPEKEVANAVAAVTTITPSPLIQIEQLLEMAMVDCTYHPSDRPHEHSVVFGVARVLLERGRLYTSNGRWQRNWQRLLMMIHDEDAPERLRYYGIDAEKHQAEKQTTFKKFYDQRSDYHKLLKEKAELGQTRRSLIKNLNDVSDFANAHYVSKKGMRKALRVITDDLSIIVNNLEEEV